MPRDVPEVSVLAPVLLMFDLSFTVPRQMSIFASLPIVHVRSAVRVVPTKYALTARLLGGAGGRVVTSTGALYAELPTVFCARTLYQ